MNNEPTNLPLGARVWRSGLQAGFHLLYNQLAWTYDTVSDVVSAGKWREWQRAALPFVRGPRVLELGHGPGHTLLDLQQAGYDVTGIDLSPAMGRQALRHGRSHGALLGIVRGRAQTLPFPTAGFDTVIALFPTPYVVDPATLSEVYRVLVPGGRFIILPEARLRPTSTSNRALEQLYRVTGQRPSSAPDTLQAAPDPAMGRTAFWTQALTSSPHWTADRIAVENLVVADSHVLLIIAER